MPGDLGLVELVSNSIDLCRLSTNLFHHFSKVFTTMKSTDCTDPASISTSSDLSALLAQRRARKALQTVAIPQITVISSTFPPSTSTLFIPVDNNATTPSAIDTGTARENSATPIRRSLYSRGLSNAGHCQRSQQASCSRQHRR